MPKKPSGLQTTAKIPDLHKISNEIKNKAQEKPVVEIKNDPLKVKEEIKEEVFTEEQLSVVWSNYVEKLRNEKKAAELSVVNQPYELKNNFHVVIKLSNSLQEDILARFKIELTKYLRQSLQNNEIKISTVIVQEELKQRLYTSQDKFNFLVQKNPKLLELKQRLGLEYDY